MPPNADLSLLFRLRGDNTQLKGTIADSRAAVAQLRQAFGPQLTQTVTVANKVFSDLDGNLQNFVAQRVPLVGAAVARVTDGLRGFAGESAKSEKAFTSLTRSIESLATRSGKSVPQVASFLTKFVQLEGQAKRNEAAFQFFGGSVDLVGNKTAKFIPELESASTSLAAVSAESVGAGAALRGLAHPLALIVVAVVAVNAAAAVAVKQLIDLTKRSADFQGKMVDLAQQTGVAVKTLSALEILARRSGGEIGNLTQALVGFQRKLDEAQDPLSKTAELFRKFNITTADTETSLRSAFLALAAMPEGFAQTNAAAELFGARGGKQVLAILKEADGDIDGVIKKLGELGILISEDAARASDKLNDELELLNFQFRALGAAAAQDLIPILTDVVKSLGEIVRAIHPLISVLGSLTAKLLTPVKGFFQGLSFVVKALTFDVKGLTEALKELREARDIPAIKIPELAPIPLPGAATPEQSASEAINQADAVLAAVKRKAAEQNQALDSLFQQGRLNRTQEAESVVNLNRQVLKADQDRIDALLRQKEIEINALDEAQKNRGEIVRRDTDDYRAITAEIVKLQQERLDKESEFDVSSRAIRAKAAKENADARRNQIANETDIFNNETDRQIKDTEAQIQRGATVEREGLALIEQLEQAKIDARIESLEQQKRIGFLTIENQRDLDDQLIKARQERDRLIDDQTARRLQRERNAAERSRDIQIANIDALVQIAQTRGQRIIDAQNALAEARIITEEQAAEKILAIRLGLIDAEIEATKAKLTAAGSIVDASERIRVEADLNNQIKILTEERFSIQAAGEREIHDGRKRDLDNFRQYADELEDIAERVTQIQRDAAEDVIRSMRLNFASRREIIRARTKLDLDDEEAQHRAAQRELDDRARENRQSNRTALEKLNIEFEINRAREAEAERHRAAMRGIKDQGRRDEENASPFGQLRLGTDDLKEFANTLESQIIPLGETLKNTFLQVADAIGQTVANWVLLGETGPAVMRKILAQALASIAAEATVNAIKELALGFATLFFNPAESAAHFTAAALWGSIAGVSAIAGRGVAGDLFKSKSGSGGSADTGRPGQINPLTLERNPQPQTIRHVLHVTVDDGEFGRAINTHFGKGFQSGGMLREIVLNDGVFTG